MKTQLQGKVVEVGELKELNNANKTKVQEIILNVLSFDSNTGEKIGDSNFPVSFFNEKIESNDVRNLLGKIVKLDCYLRSSVSQVPGSPAKYFVNLTGRKVSIVQ